MGPRCSKCGRPTNGKVRSGLLGARLCAACYDKQLGFVVGAKTGGAGGAVAGPGILSWVRKSLGR